MVIYTSDGRIARRRVGFADDPMEFVPDKGLDTSPVDLIGSSYSYWSETEGRLDSNKVIGKDKPNG